MNRFTVNAEEDSPLFEMMESDDHGSVPGHVVTAWFEKGMRASSLPSEQVQRRKRRRLSADEDQKRETRRKQSA